MDPELKDLLSSLATGLAIGLAIGSPFMIYRFIKTGRFFKKREKPEPKWTWPLGIITFGGLSIMSFTFGKPYFGTFFAIAFIPYVVGLIRSKKKAEQANH